MLILVVYFLKALIRCMKMSSAEVACSKYLPYITDDFKYRSKQYGPVTDKFEYRSKQCEPRSDCSCMP